VSPATPDVPAVLARHGVDPDADAAALLAALEARGWEAGVEGPGTDGAGRTPRFRALAFRRRAVPRDRGHGTQDHRQASGRTAEEALGRVLAAVLERGGGTGG
jgi:hypothetical protein